MAEFEDTRPAYERIAADIRARIMSGELAPGDELPSTAALVAAHGAANTTIQKALAVLKAEGWIVSRNGVGRNVRSSQVRVITAGSYFDPAITGASYELLDVREDRPGGDIGQALAVVDGAAIVRHRLMRDKTGPLEVDWSYYPLTIAAGTPLAERKKIKGGAPAVLARLGLAEQHFEDIVSARGATEYEARHLLLPPGVPVLRILRRTFAGDDRLITVTVLVKAAHLLAQRYMQST